jgi:hypothetical protein
LTKLNISAALFGAASAGAATVSSYSMFNGVTGRFDCRDFTYLPCSAVEAARRAPFLERVKGIEPSYSAWKAATLPLTTPAPAALARPCLAKAVMRPSSQSRGRSQSRANEATQLATPERLSKILVSMAQQIKVLYYLQRFCLLSTERRLQDILTDDDNVH